MSEVITQNISNPQLDPGAVYTMNAEAARQTERTVAARADRIGYLRLFYFFGWVALAVYVFVEFGLAWGIAAVVLGLLGFGRLVGMQQAADAERARQQRIVAINEGELESIAYRFDRFDGGARYADALHPYTGDLDVFGPKSVYALVNRTVSVSGEQALADYMRYCLTDETLIAERQAAIAELTPELAWRQAFAAAAPRGEQTVDQLDKLRAWARAAPEFQERYWAVLLWVVPLVNLAWLVSFAYLPFFVALLGYAPTFWLLYRNKARVDAIEEATTASVAALLQLSATVAQIDAKAWGAPLLAGSAACLRGFGIAGSRSSVQRGAAMAKPTSASARISRLASDVRQLAVRANPFVLILNLFGLWEIKYARRIEHWKVALASEGQVLATAEQVATPVPSERSKPRTDGTSTRVGHTATDGTTAPEGALVTGGIPTAASFQLPTDLAEPLPPTHPIETWLLVAGAFDALSSMAAVAHRYPSWRMPQISGQAKGGVAQLRGTGLHHPLLPPSKSVPNDFRSPLHTHVSLLTGSNMAGKSTLLRTIGLHLVMAQWGMPTPARELSLSPVNVYTSMRTQDNLHEGASAFYAELNRLRIVVDATRAGEAVFFLLDEILKGTNSQDRNAGGRALIEQLLHYGGAGVVATHDLGLGELADETSAVSTLRLEVETNADGELYFDYTVKPGLAQSRNASALMRKLGLGVIES